MVIAVITGAFSAFAKESGFKVYESVIVVDAAETDVYATQKLKHYLDRITGKSLEIPSNSSGA